LLLGRYNIFGFFILGLAISFVGVATIFGVSYKNAFGEIDYSSSIKQLIFFVTSILIYFILSNIKFTQILKSSYFIFAITSLLLLMVFFVGTTIFGSRRWIVMGPISIQPSEFAKFSLLILLASLSEKLFKKSDVLKLIIFGSFVSFLPFVMVYFQPDLGTSVIFFVAYISFLINSPNIPSKFLKILFLLTIIAIPVGWFFMKDYQKERVYEFSNAVLFGKGYDDNVQKSLEAITNGGVFGKGLGFGPDSVLRFLPSKQTDFIIAVVFESYGIFGGGIIFLFYLFLITDLWMVVPKMETRGAIVFSTCSASIITFQILVNIGVNFGILPVTGIPAPFLSSGGSSLITNFAILGVLSSATKDKVFETTKVKKNDLEFIQYDM